jgi:hypothetical protein
LSSCGYFTGLLGLRCTHPRSKHVTVAMYQQTQGNLILTCLPLILCCCTNTKNHSLGQSLRSPDKVGMAPLAPIRQQPVLVVPNASASAPSSQRASRPSPSRPINRPSTQPANRIAYGNRYDGAVGGVPFLPPARCAHAPIPLPPSHQGSTAIFFPSYLRTKWWSASNVQDGPCPQSRVMWIFPYLNKSMIR